MEADRFPNVTCPEQKGFLLCSSLSAGESLVLFREPQLQDSPRIPAKMCPEPPWPGRNSSVNCWDFLLVLSLDVPQFPQTNQFFWLFPRGFFFFFLLWDKSRGSFGKGQDLKLLGTSLLGEISLMTQFRSFDLIQCFPSSPGAFGAVSSWELQIQGSVLVWGSTPAAGAAFPGVRLVGSPSSPGAN